MTEPAHPARCSLPCARGARHLLLMGLRGSGKSTLAIHVAHDLSLPSIDLDNLTTRILGSENVRAAFARHGQRIFRQAELSALRQALAEPTHVIALGGGTTTAPGAADLLHAARGAGSCIVYLRADAACLRTRLAQGDVADRPSLTGAGVLDEIDDVLSARDPLYLDLASHVIEIDALDEDACARTIADIWRKTS